jgi:hypothetical protein
MKAIRSLSVSVAVALFLWKAPPHLQLVHSQAELPDAPLNFLLMFHLSE